MEAILLAAGVGRRLASLDGQTPKCLLEFEGKSLLVRHLEILQECGVTRVTIVLGHLNEMIESALQQWRGEIEAELEVATAYNAEFRHGSIISLKVGLDAVGEGSAQVVMDADVLYHSDVLARLIEADFDNGFLLDARSEASGEEMMLGVRGERVCAIRRQIGNDWDVLGEGVGFFKVSAKDLPALVRTVNHRLEDPANIDADYESAIDAFLKDCEAYYAPVVDLPWTEIDFDEDVERARSVILPAIASRGRNEGTAE